jgi:tetratricopeptide (TPR) repeat protein
MSESKNDIHRYRALLRRDPRSRVFAPLAEACRREGLLDEALAVARAGVAQHPVYAGGRIALARALMDLGRVREAAEELDRAASASPGSAIAYRLLGEARARLHDRSGAFEAFARALALDPSDDLARRGVIAFDALMESWGPPPPEGGVESERGELDLALEALVAEEIGAEPIPERGFEETAEEDESELGILLIPEEPAAEGEEVPIDGPAAGVPDAAGEREFLAARIEILDIAHSSLAPEATEAAWDLPGEEPAAFSGAEAGTPGEDATPEEASLPPDLQTETLADLYVQQGHVERARGIYQAILATKPLHLRVKKKLHDLPPPPAEGSPTGRKIADLNRWLNRVRTAADRPPSGASGTGNS